jgi:hypothetical protein
MGEYGVEPFRPIGVLALLLLGEALSDCTRTMLRNELPVSDKIIAMLEETSEEPT